MEDMVFICTIVGQTLRLEEGEKSSF